MRIPDTDLFKVMVLLRTKTFCQVAEAYGYNSSWSKAGGAVNQYLKKHGIDPAIFRKRHRKTKNNSWGFKGQYTLPEDEQQPPKLVREYFDAALNATVKVYEPRHATY